MDYLKELCEDLNIHPDTTEGRNVLPLSEDLKIEMAPLDPGVLFYSPIGTCPETKREDFFILLMKANLFGQGTMGASLALNPEENLLTLSRDIPYDMKYGPFREAVEDFANMVDYWREELQRHNEMAKGDIL